MAAHIVPRAPGPAAPRHRWGTSSGRAPDPVKKGSAHLGWFQILVDILACPCRSSGRGNPRAPAHTAAHRHILRAGSGSKPRSSRFAGRWGSLVFRLTQQLPLACTPVSVREQALSCTFGEAGDLCPGPSWNTCCYRQGVLLDLPAVVGGAVVRQLDEEIPLHRPPHTPRPTAGTRRLRAINAPKATALRSSTSQSPWPKWSCFILVRPSPPW